MKNFSIVKKGYDPQQVESYISSLENEINSYQEKEKAITGAIISAQVISDQLVSNAKEEAAQITNDAKARFTEMQSMFDEAEENLKIFQEEYNKLISRYLVSFNEKDINSLIEKLHSIRESFTFNDNQFKNDKESQARNISQEAKSEVSTGISKEEMDSLFGRNE